MNRQEIFNKVATHMLTQKKKSEEIGESGIVMCKFHHDDLRCAIGALIPDELYDTRLEGNSVQDLLILFEDERDDFLIAFNEKFLKHLDISPESVREDAEFLYELQSIHDITVVEEWYLALKAFANNHDLTPPPIF